MFSVNPCFSVLSNYEVMESLKNIKDTKKKYGLRNLATIAYETLQFLEDSPSKHQNREAIVAFINDMQPYKLTTNECLMMVNDPPSSALHIQLLIEDSEERLTEEQVAQIIEIAKTHFPGPPQETN
ncbi:DNA-directed RNA polymerase III subunit RPC9 isoform X2 [Lucilia sericata]|uniref:DNA-directed RNA polymerase III subunit RPC9 isoform X2 n=1 Tax=Lucilia sericata TaxID=13632 RepID=UPI0018A81E4F|nr:DNA-directed RNA polymerase III subunit RPC9 isoform X2 [Lucilia sericata]